MYPTGRLSTTKTRAYSYTYRWNYLHLYWFKPQIDNNFAGRNITGDINGAHPNIKVDTAVGLRRKILPRHLIHLKSQVNKNFAVGNFTGDIYHMSVLCSFGISTKDEELDLPSLYLIPKLHKCPFKQRYIAGAAKCSTKPLSKY